MGVTAAQTEFGQDRQAVKKFHQFTVKVQSSALSLTFYPRTVNWTGK